MKFSTMIKCNRSEDFANKMDLLTDNIKHIIFKHTWGNSCANIKFILLLYIYHHVSLYKRTRYLG